mmetsp:Transcript_27240/g.57058  ORF Transcript_27240/g.57058 Transcript_27240/m.57058 type:complete len:283 (+) Transcript_27240:36-884(+)
MNDQKNLLLYRRLFGFLLGTFFRVFLSSFFDFFRSRFLFRCRRRRCVGVVGVGTRIVVFAIVAVLVVWLGGGLFCLFFFFLIVVVVVVVVGCCSHFCHSTTPPRRRRRRCVVPVGVTATVAATRSDRVFRARLRFYLATTGRFRRRFRLRLHQTIRRFQGRSDVALEEIRVPSLVVHHGTTRQSFAVRLRRFQAPRGEIVAGHERLNALEDGSDGPQRVPGFRVEIAHGHADLGAGLEPAAGRQHVHGGCLHGVLGGKDEFSDVHPSLVRGFGGTPDGVVPL